MINNIKIKEILEKKFNLKEFRGIQEKIIYSVLNGNNTLGIMPTGGGKSLTYQIAGMYNSGTTLVISPLISLMQDQVNFLKSKKISAAFYNGSLTSEEKVQTMDLIKDGSLKFLFVSPERLFIHENFEGLDDFITIIQKYININLIVIDEAHCISSWGHDFREDYLRLKELNQKFNIPFLNLTATADPITKSEIEEIFSIKEENSFSMPIKRDNITYTIDKKHSSGFEQVLKIIKSKKEENGIVYCFTKADVDKLTKFLKSKDILVESYHADLTTTKKTKVLKDFLNNKIKVVVATIAFGMGIDKSNINYVIHKEISQSLENYYQETGRVGRDGSKSFVYLLHSNKDFVKMNFISNSSSRKWVQKIKLNWMKRYMETTICRIQSLNWYFENIKGKPCGKCDICKNKNLFQIQNSNLITFLNENIINKEINLFTLENFISENLNGLRYNNLDYLYQLIFDNKIDYDRKSHNVLLKDTINLDYKFNESLEINDTIDVVIKKKVVRKKSTSKTSTIKSKTTTNTNTKVKKTPTKKKRTLSPEHLKKMQDARKEKQGKK